jgi:hypothetical protein
MYSVSIVGATAFLVDWNWYFVGVQTTIKHLMYILVVKNKFLPKTKTQLGRWINVI